MHACDIKFMGINVCGTSLISKTTNIPSKYTRYTVTNTWVLKTNEIKRCIQYTCVLGVSLELAPSLRDEFSPVILFWEVYTHVCPISVDGADHTHTLMGHRAPLV